MSEVRIPGPPKATVIKAGGGALLFLTVIPAFLVTQWMIGGIWGFILGIVVGLAIWYLVLIILWTVVGFWYFRCKGQPIDQEVVAIVDQAFDTQDWHIAVRRLEDLILQKGESVQRLTSLGGMQLESGEFKRASRTLERALVDAPDEIQWAIRTLQAEELCKIGRPKEALELIQKILESGWKSHGVYCTGATALLELDRSAEAMQYLKLAKEARSATAIRLKSSRPFWHQMIREEKKLQEQIESKHSVNPS